jgi:nucleoside-diphosphate-sugar epimerase
MTYIDDCIQGFILAGEKKAALSEVFIIAGPKPAMVNQVVKTLAQAAGIKLKLWHVPALPMMTIGKVFGLVENVFHLSMPFSDRTIQLLSQSRTHSVKKAKKVLGHQPRVYLKEGIAKTVSWYKATGFI